MQEHTTEWMDALLEVVSGAGGRTLVIRGEEGPGRYQAGVRYAPTPTLFEAVLRCVLGAGQYSRIVAFTGEGFEHLPSWRLGADLHLGAAALVWVVRGERNGAASTTTAGARPFWETTADAFETTERFDRLLWRSTNRPYWDRLDEFARRVDEERSRAVGERVALVVDGAFLLPSPQESGDILGAARREGSALDAFLANKLSRGFGRDLAGTKLDVIVLSENGLVLDLVGATKPSVIARAVATYAHPHEWESIRPRLEGVLPPVGVSGSARVACASRAIAPTPPALSGGPTDGAETLYAALRRAELRRGPLPPSPPRRPDRVELDFWANLDLSPLELAFDREIFGQHGAKQQILNLLRSHCERCAQALATDPRKVATPADTFFRLPVLAFFGAAGTGKTTFLKVMSSSLFGDERFGRRIDLGGKSLEAETVGIRPPYVNCDRATALIEFARLTGGLGLFSFDEITGVETSGRKSLADTLRTVFQLLQDRYFEPANPALRPAAGRFHLANTIFLMSGNVTDVDTAPGSGFVSVNELGSAFVSRMTEIIYFEPLRPEDLVEGARKAINRAARRWAESFAPELRAALAEGPAVDKALVDAVARRFEFVARRKGEEPSFRTLDAVVGTLRFDGLVEAARGGGGLVVGTAAIPKEWNE